ncbi:hypothetical protein [Arthrobacter mobilis]|uniref:Uncharacterized protein n=1 Tax=Arthrobacter mobilis TaxID=2724944 RepID=A0A7X6HCQ2_9MICC|nr:hypothetical protein [Arthrobacter mobilis]NKX53252.1 hypothetical protein [Arthrobacter mobilis]
MHLLHVLATVAPNPEPTLRPGLDPTQVTPGPWGFFITFALAVVLILLIRDMTKRIRRVRYRQQLSEAEIGDAQAAEAAGGSGPAAGSGEPDRERPHGTARPEPPAGPGKYGPGN